jgi:bifunctional dethiobiotin synthetase / adenosylmethionine---8-amino-7-oxononanoate aminotransferase
MVPDSTFEVFRENDFLAKTVEDLFSTQRNGSDLAVAYEKAIQRHIHEHERTQGMLGACLIEPIMQGAGGMVFVDPLFQMILVKVSPL